MLIICSYLFNGHNVVFNYTLISLNMVYNSQNDAVTHPRSLPTSLKGPTTVGSLYKFPNL